jgi:cell cycle arrest protein BUB3
MLTVSRIDLQTGELTVLSKHNAGARNVVYSRDFNLLITGSWDSTLHVHDLSKPDSVPAIIELPSKVFSMSLSSSKLVVAMASRAVFIYELRTLADVFKNSNAAAEPHIVAVEPWQKRESSMKYMTRAVACMPNDDGYASSSIEGRVAVEWFDPSEQSQSRKYAFKCHRQTVDGQDIVYPVHALAFNPVHGTFASGGGDGGVALWDGVAKRRIRQYAKYPVSVNTLSFSHDGKFLAVGISPGFEEGKEDYSDGINKVYIRELAEGEAAAKKQK